MDEELQRTQERLASIQALIVAGAEMDLDLLLERVIDVTMRATRSDQGGIYLLDAEGKNLVLAAHLGHDGPIAERHRRLPIDESPTGAAATRLVARAITPTDLPSVRNDAGTVFGVQEIALVPLHVRGRLVGSLNLGRKRAEPYTDADLRWAETLAAQVAVSVDNAKLHSEAQKRLGHLTLLLDLTRLGAESHDVRSVLDQALDPMVSAFGADYMCVYLLHEQRLRISGHRWKAPELRDRVDNRVDEVALDDTTLVGRAAIAKRTVVLGVDEWPAATRDLARGLLVRHGAAAPLLAEDRLVGVLLVVRLEARPFQSVEIQMLESCAAHFGGVVEHARLFHEGQRRARDLSLMNELGGIIAQHRDLSAVLTVGVKQASKIVDVPNTFLMLFEPEANVLRLVASTFESPPAGLVLPVEGPSLAQRAFTLRRPVTTDDALADPNASAELAARFAHRVVLAVPLIAEGKPIGAMIMGDTRPDRRFLPAEIETAVAISNQLAAAVVNARLFEDLTRSYEKLAKTQEALIRQERLAALGELAAVMAHEVRNPLAIIFNAVASLRKMPQPNEDGQTLLRIVAEEAEQLNRIVGDLLDFAKPHEPIFIHESLDGIVQAALEAAKGAERTPDVEFLVTIPRTLPRPYIDGRMIKQALINLILNAIQSGGGRIAISGCEAVRNGESMVEVSVVDNGQGIAQGLGSLVFQPFFTTKASGTGLGLTIVKRIAETHRGEVTLEPTPGGGTTSTLRLPLGVHPAEAAKARLGESG